MSNPTIPVHPSPSAPRPRPVVWYGAFTAGLGAFLGFAGLTDLMPKTVIAWIALVGAVVTAAGAVLVQSTVTPLSSPRDARDVPMVAQDVADAQATQAAATAVAEVVPLQSPAAARYVAPNPPGLGSTQPRNPFPRD